MKWKLGKKFAGLAMAAALLTTGFGATGADAATSQKYLDYASVKQNGAAYGFWGYFYQPVTVSDTKTTTYDNAVTYWDYTAKRTAYIDDATLANKFSELSKPTEYTYADSEVGPDGNRYSTVVIRPQTDGYGNPKYNTIDGYRIFNQSYADISSKFDFDGAYMVKVYLSEGAGGSTGRLAGREDLMAIHYIEVLYSNASGKTDRIYRADPTNNTWGYIDTFADENKAVYDYFFAPVQG